MDVKRSLLVVLIRERERERGKTVIRTERLLDFFLKKNSDYAVKYFFGRDLTFKNRNLNFKIVGK